MRNKTLYPNLLEDVYNNILQDNSLREVWEVTSALTHKHPSYNHLTIRSAEWYKFRSNVKRKLNKLVKMNAVATEFTTSTTKRNRYFGPINIYK